MCLTVFSAGRAEALGQAGQDPQRLPRLAGGHRADRAPDGAGQLLEQLNSGDYAQRMKATDALKKMGASVVPLLRRGAKDAEAETTSRINGILKHIREEWAVQQGRKVLAKAIWQRDAALPDEIHAVGDWLVHDGFGPRNRLTVTSIATGRDVWSNDRKLSIYPTTIAVCDQAIYVMEHVSVGLALGEDGGLAPDFKTQCQAYRLEDGKALDGFVRRLAVGRPSVADNKVFLYGTRSFGCMDRRTGQRIWARDIKAMPLHPAVVDDHAVYVVTLEGVLYALRRADGGLLWKRKAVDLLMESLQVHEDVLVLKLTNSVRAYECESGEVLWHSALPEHPRGQAFRARLLEDRQNADDERGRIACYFLPRPFVVKGEVVYLSQGSNIMALGLKTGGIRWRYDPQIEEDAARQWEFSSWSSAAGRVTCGGPRAYRLSAPAMADQATILFGSEVGLHALDTKQQVELWRIPTGAPVTRRPLVAPGGVLFGRDSQLIERSVVRSTGGEKEFGTDVLKDVDAKCYFLPLGPSARRPADSKRSTDGRAMRDGETPDEE
jgi:outer membrane protein assembly factor BamB